MSDLITRAQKAKVVIGDPSLPKWERLSRGLEAFSGLVLSELADDVREPFEADLAQVNGLVAKHALEQGDDFQRIGDADLQQMLDLIDTAASRAIAAELDRIVAGLDAGTKKLPVEAIREARIHRELMVLRLIRVLQEATSAARAGDLPEGNAHFHAVFLLTEFQAAEAFPVILEAFSLPGELPFDLLGDAVTSTLARILALFASDRPELMDALIGDQALNQYVRWEAAQCYVHLVRDGRLGRDEAVARLQRLLRQAIDRSDATVIGGLICVLVSFAPHEALEDIQEAYQRGLVETFLVDMGTVEESIAGGETWVRRELDTCPATGIEDTIEVLRHWASFAEKPSPRPVPPPPTPHFRKTPAPAVAVAAAVSPRQPHKPRVGRNDPCPCGSGKKYKKCCLSAK